MTRVGFFMRTRRWPKDDDLDRVNCRHAGRIGHMCCGWCKKHRAPMFQCFCRSIATFSELVKDENAMPFRGPVDHA